MDYTLVFLSDLEELLLRASHIARAHFGKRESTLARQTKSNDTPVTRVDYEISALLKNSLLAMTPRAGWLGEEDREDPTRLSKEYVWIVDPLDGTKEFIRGIPEVAISIALVRKGHPVIGAVVNPITGERGLWSEREGSRYVGFDSSSRPCAAHDLREAVANASRTEFDKGSLEPFRPALRDIRPFGSVAYKLLRLAAGLEHLYFSVEPKSEWDICGGVSLVLASKCIYSRFDGRLLRFNRPSTRIRSGAVAAHPELVQRFLEACSKQIREKQKMIQREIVR